MLTAIDLTLSNELLFLPAMAFLGMSEDITCGDDFIHPQTHAYQEHDDENTTCLALEATTSGKLQIMYLIKNAICSDEVNYFKVSFGETVGAFALITFMYSRHDGSFLYKQCPASVENGGSTFEVECALQCANDFRIFIEWMPGSDKNNFCLCGVELSTPVRNVELNVG